MTRFRCYDNRESVDRYTVVFDIDLGGEYPYLAMSDRPFHPQGIGQHGGHYQPVDLVGWGKPPEIGKSCYLGKRIPFRKLPPDCRRAAAMDFKAYFLDTNKS